MPLGGLVEAGRTVLGHHGEAVLLGKVTERLLPHVDKRSDDSDGPVPRGVLGLHRGQVAVLEGSDKETKESVIRPVDGGTSRRRRRGAVPGRGHSTRVAGLPPPVGLSSSGYKRHRSNGVPALFELLR